MTKQAFQAIKECLLARYPGNFHRTVTIRDFLEQICKRHLDLDLGDTNLSQKLCSGDEPRYWQQLSEILLGHELLEAGLLLTPAHEGPDFRIPYQDRNIWIEVICPRPEGIPPEWLMGYSGKAISMPHEAMLLRWTAAIKEKAEKLLGNSVSGAKGYIQKGIVGPNDIYVVAINARLLRSPNFPFASVTGISQLPLCSRSGVRHWPLCRQY
jgi:type I restriction enzyme S subunit